MLRVAVVGVGWAGTRHVEAVRELDRKLTVDCLVDNDPAHLREKSEELSVEKTYTELSAALADPEVDAVSICTPHGLHRDAAVAAAEAGKHVICEKPLAVTVDDATEMIEAAARADVKLYTAENVPYSPMSRFLREIVTSGKHIGEVVSASFASGFRAETYGYPGRRAWLSTPELGGTGTWMLHGIHSMAQLRFVLGEVDTVYMREHHAAAFTRPDLEGTMVGLLTMSEGFPVTVTQSCEVRLRGTLGGYVIHGDRGSVRATAEGCEVFGEGVEGESLHLEYPESELSDYAMEMEAFADYVETGVPGPTSAESERRSLAVVQAGYESAQSGQPVYLRTRFGAL